MKILAIDSTATAASVAVTDDDKLLAEYTLLNGNTHSETLLPMIEDILLRLGISAKDIELFACSVGPGSFTGVRIGTATVKGLAFATNKPCVGVSTLEALAYNLVGFEGLLCPVMNARRSQVYTALFSSDGNTLTRITDDAAMAISELDDMLSQKNAPVRFCGDGYDITLKELTKTDLIATPERLRTQSAYSVACVALKKYRNGEAVSDTELVSTYLRPCQAERERNERLAMENKSL